ncbi:hypothetical protein [Myxococcus virescens]|uniref:Uncharacterized protein n=1 Tax=Myxococcus virescens TaxID=83456 RepID=A0A511HMS5_9BACT|nr:hypothetical protein [Myxococcus virescens]GEL74888.1 hypothetical protein MVI01_66720 [Myxococcus virescens]SDE60877.1 hypothetical protein SAMN04488504_10961 [Myxococcus virescens]
MSNTSDGLQSQLGVKEHSNTLTFRGMKDAQFSLQSYSITSGQPFDGVRSQGGATLSVLAGRKHSKPVGDWYNAQPAGAKLHTHTELSAPDELNFAIRGTLTLDDGNGPIVCENVVIAQGCWGSVNYWWFTAPGMVSSNEDVQYAGQAGTLQCSQRGRPIRLHFITEGGDNRDYYDAITVKVTS